jgi:guanylate kinase
MSGNLIVIAAASGTGKTSLVKALLEQDKQIGLSVSHTTRAPRPGEVDGKDYHFVDEATFIRMESEGQFLESAQVHGARYGTSKQQVTAQLESGRDLLLEIDWQGAQQIKRLFPTSTTIFILPPSIDALEARLKGRGQDSDAVIMRRLQAAKSEISHVAEFDYVTINDKFEQALKDLLLIIGAQRLKCANQLKRNAQLVRNLI